MVLPEEEMQIWGGMGSLETDPHAQCIDFHWKCRGAAHGGETGLSTDSCWRTWGALCKTTTRDL